MRLKDQCADLKQFAGSSSPAPGILFAALNAMMPEARILSNDGLKKVIQAAFQIFLPFKDPNTGQHKQVPRCFQWNTKWCCWSVVIAFPNPNGIEAFSPGLRGTSYPG
jgi:hypothetical protein